MQPPVTHYKDEPTIDKDTAELVNQQMNAEANAAKAPEKAEELKVLPVEKPAKKQTNASNIVNAFRQKMANAATPIELPSIGKTVEFKEISTAEQKELSKISLQSNSRADIMYCAMLALINKLAVEKSFDIRDYSEFERIFVTLNLQQMNKINPEIKFTCSECGRENAYTLDTQKMLRNFAKTYKPDQTFEVELGNRKFTFTTGWPKVSSVEDFFKNYYRKYDGSGKAIKESMDNLSQIEYVTMFVKSVTVAENADPEDKMTANLEEMTYNERVQIVDCLPQSVLFDDNTGVVSKVIETFVEPMNQVFKYRDCAFCGAPQDGQVANLTDFLGG
jgi:hypothetical protein